MFQILFFSFIWCFQFAFVDFTFIFILEFEIVRGSNTTPTTFPKNEKEISKFVETKENGGER